jgi:hypothetical protein
MEMKKANVRIIRWMALACAVAALAACGGGGSSNTTAPPAPDARNGTYTMMAADAREYSLALDFDAKSYHVSGNGTDQSGAFVADGNTFQFQPGNSVGTTGTSTTRFSYVADTVVGEFTLPTGALPFVASRTFAKSIPTTTLTFNLLGRTVDTAGGPADTTIQQGQVTSDGHLRTCENTAMSEIANCPVGSTTVGTLTVADGLFTAAISAGNVTFRLATVGSDTVFLRASASSGTTRRFIIGTPAVNTFSNGSFVGGTTEPTWGTASIGTATFSTAATSPSGVTTTQSGTATAVGANTLGSLLVLSTTSAGNFFATSSAQIGAIVAAHGNPTAPGFMTIGVRQ